MNLRTENYLLQRDRWPSEGRHIMAQYDEDSIVVYQAYGHSIGRFAARHGYFGGDFSLSRMSWVKPNFLWMMYRSGWGTKEGQEVTLAVRLKRDFFERVLAEAVPSSFDSELHENVEEWKSAVASSRVRLQWDPDHAPNGEDLTRRAIQLGLRGAILQEYAQEAILEIEDISVFVTAQRAHIGNIERLETPSERVFVPGSQETVRRLRLTA